MGRFVPNIVVLKTLKQLGLRNEKLEREVPKMVQQGLQQIYDEQNDDGGWGWFKGDETHRFMTAYVVYGLALAQQAGFEVDRERVKRGIQALWQLLRNEKNSELQAYMLFALTEAMRAWGNLAGSKADMLKFARNIAKATEKSPLPPMAQSVLTIALHQLGEKAASQRCLSALEKQAQIVNGLCYWEGTWKVLGESDVEATAYALKALLMLKPNDPKILNAVMHLTQVRTGNFWYSTKSTVAALFALTDYLRHSRELQADYNLKVFANGELVHEGLVTKEHTQQSELTLKAPASIGKNSLSIQKVGTGLLYYTVALKSFRTEGLTKPEGNLLTVQRQYFVRGKDGNWTPLKGSVRPATEVAVQLKVTAKQDLEYVMVEDPLPSGWEVVQREVGEPAQVEGLTSDWWTKVEIHDDRLALFMTYMPKGTHHFSYLLRPETEGIQTALPTVAQIMYRPQIRGRGVEARLRVQE
ncbi:MAG: hypothetical protein NZ805_06440 [Armatimonadetes bacterium]|nr:hypothetical protein [Armatimonadota bacterium]MDW8028948.1 hypothetical protein [Armatimonadota bacterium]